MHIALLYLCLFDFKIACCGIFLGVLMKPCFVATEVLGGPLCCQEVPVCSGRLNA